MKKMITAFNCTVFCLAIAMPAMTAEKPKEIQRSPIATFKNGFTLEQSKKFLSAHDIATWLSGGDTSVWVFLNFSQVLPTAVVPNRQPARELPKAIMPEIGEIKAETKHFGSLTLDEFMTHPKSYAQAFIVVHKGKIVYENYPAMQPTDAHAWASNAKVLPSLVIDLLISDGKIDENKTIGFYVPEFRGTAWKEIRVRDVMDMTPGLRAPSDCSVETAVRWGQVLGLGGSVPLVEAILGSRLATDFGDERFWASVIRWLIANLMLDMAQVGPIMDYIHHQKFEPLEVVVAPGQTENGPLQPDFSIQGRTPASILRQMREWYGDLRKEPQQHTEVTWYESGICEFDWTEGSATSANQRRWTIREILTRRELFNEGCAMRHCVASYEHTCASGRSSIWSMGIERNDGRRKRVLTVEVAVDRKGICQARGKANRLPTAKEMDILHRWAVEEGLTVDASVKSR